MIPSITLREMETMPEYQACIVTLEQLRLAQERLGAWSIVRDEHDERSREARVISQLEGLKTEEQMVVLRCQADVQRAFVHFVETLIKRLEPTEDEQL